MRGTSLHAFAVDAANKSRRILQDGDVVRKSLSPKATPDDRRAMANLAIRRHPELFTTPEDWDSIDRYVRGGTSRSV
jgi:hypothetical protein